MSAHVPAWKRLGLQLKNVQAAPGASPPVSSPQPPPKRRKLSDDGEPDNGTLIAGKVLNGSVEGGAAGTNGLQKNPMLRDQKVQQTLTGDEGIREDVVDSGLKEKKKHKSVTFDADTKTGNEVPISSKKSNTGEEITAEASSEVNAEPLQTGKKKEKTKRKKNRPKDDSTDQSNPRSSPNRASDDEKPKYLAYLDAYSHDKANWKFNTNYQKRLLENVFHLYRVPSTYDEALVDYIKGLQSGQARTRLREDANSILTKAAEDKNDTETSTAANGDVDGASHGSTTNEMAKQKTARAKALLDALQSRGSLTEHDTERVSAPDQVVDTSTSKLNIASADKTTMSQQTPAEAEKTKKKRGRKKRSGAGTADEDPILSDSSV